MESSSAPLLILQHWGIFQKKWSIPLNICQVRLLREKVILSEFIEPFILLNILDHKIINNAFLEGICSLLICDD